ncbi:MAG: nucleotidyl transferase AbiEii/AbiGii toxin family protein [Oscillospiraceae bacterium]|jgi:predicted nucleotidyltransferase component of viral defense system|nr:nucleotidyl transferase AbiEii/AbiGii toxin family protein [Oscillospiraceae bacterium]
MNDWRIRHGEVIAEFIAFLNNDNTNYVLKGGTALAACYNLDRFSEDIDLDGTERQLIEIVEEFCSGKGYDYRVAKDTNTVQRCVVNYGNVGKPLKIEASYRRTHIDERETARVNGVLVYSIEQLCAMKINAYMSRDKMRDLYDIAFICNNFIDSISPQTTALLRNALEYKGLEQFDYMINTQSDELINPDKLAEDFLKMFDKLGLLVDENEKKHLGNGNSLKSR